MSIARDRANRSGTDPVFLNNTKLIDSSGNLMVRDVSGNDRKLIALDAGSQGGFNSDSFFSKKYDKYFEPILVDPLQSYPDKKQNIVELY